MGPTHRPFRAIAYRSSKEGLYANLPRAQREVRGGGHEDLVMSGPRFQIIVLSVQC